MGGLKSTKISVCVWGVKEEDSYIHVVFLYWRE